MTAKMIRKTTVLNSVNLMDEIFANMKLVGTSDDFNQGAEWAITYFKDKLNLTGGSDDEG